MFRRGSRGPSVPFAFALSFSSLSASRLFSSTVFHRSSQYRSTRSIVLISFHEVSFIFGGYNAPYWAIQRFLPPLYWRVLWSTRYFQPFITAYTSNTSYLFRVLHRTEWYWYMRRFWINWCSTYWRNWVVDREHQVCCIGHSYGWSVGCSASPFFRLKSSSTLLFLFPLGTPTRMISFLWVHQPEWYVFWKQYIFKVRLLLLWYLVEHAIVRYAALGC